MFPCYLARQCCSMNFLPMIALYIIMKWLYTSVAVITCAIYCANNDEYYESFFALQLLNKLYLEVGVIVNVVYIFSITVTLFCLHVKRDFICQLVDKWLDKILLQSINLKFEKLFLHGFLPHYQHIYYLLTCIYFFLYTDLQTLSYFIFVRQYTIYAIYATLFKLPLPCERKHFENRP